jgi:hypothetical protein
MRERDRENQRIREGEVKSMTKREDEITKE